MGLGKHDDAFALLEKHADSKNGVEEEIKRIRKEK